MAVYDHINHLGWGSVYSSDMQQLESTAPDVHNEFTKGDFVVKESEGSFNQVSTDLALEHVNKLGKIVGGIVGITRTESARNRWCLTYNDRVRLADDTRNMIGISDRDATKHKEAEKKRMERDESFVDKRLANNKKGFFERVRKQKSKTFAHMYTGKATTQLKNTMNLKLIVISSEDCLWQQMVEGV